MARRVFIIVLVLIIVGALGTAYYLAKVRKTNETGWEKIHVAEAMIEAEDYQNAVNTLLPVVQLGKRFEAPEVALYTLACAYDGAGSSESHVIWQKLVENYPDSQYYEEARLRQAQSLEKTKPEKARQIYQELSQSSNLQVRHTSLLGLAKTFETENNTEEAKTLYYDILNSATDTVLIAQAKDRLTEINSERLWSPVLDEFCKLYEVQRGDAPVEIGQKFKTTAWFILEANGLGKKHPKPGRRVKVPKEPFWIVVDKSNCRLNLLTASGRFIKWYPVGIGEQSYKTPAGEYKIETKQVEPRWYSPNDGVIPPGDPKNALGSRWMGIGSSLGIHGTNDPDTVGYRKSAGCIRMYNHAVEELYKLVTYGTRVTITENMNTDESL